MRSYCDQKIKTLLSCSGGGKNGQGKKSRKSGAGKSACRKEGLCSK